MASCIVRFRIERLEERIAPSALDDIKVKTKSGYSDHSGKAEGEDTKKPEKVKDSDHTKEGNHNSHEKAAKVPEELRKLLKAAKHHRG